MVDVLETIDRLSRSVQERLTARTAYGEPIEAHGITVVPVAKIRFGFGGGGGGGTGTGPVKHDGAMEAVEQAVQSGSGGGGGGGGGGIVNPIGFIEISDAGARWVAIEPSRAEFALRALTVLAAIAPGHGRRGFFPRLLVLAAGHAIIAAMIQPRLPPMPERFSFGREPAAETV
jgi:uncharacterized spore protein YtfJ